MVEARQHMIMMSRNDFNDVVRCRDSRSALVSYIYNRALEAGCSVDQALDFAWKHYKRDMTVRPERLDRMVAACNVLASVIQGGVAWWIDGDRSFALSLHAEKSRVCISAALPGCNATVTTEVVDDDQVADLFRRWYYGV